ncbi:hypothetical protein BB558_000581 [Smittium angustum]|uniref:Polyadenylation factor subunit 2 n=1 Tax=Smittium angustum TaxID=133377 RepID=A0A2U1JDR9_SMIAN|nr:hypothetical protein BB558_000581 [Smittium angustum]
MQQNNYFKQNTMPQRGNDGGFGFKGRQNDTFDNNRQEIKQNQGYNERFEKPMKRDQPDHHDDNFDGKRMRKPLQRRTIDYYGSIVRGLQFKTSRISNKNHFMKADPSYIVDMLIPIFDKNKSIFGVSSRFIQQAQNKIRCPVNVIRWTPEGRRIITGSSSGEFTLWNGLTFNFETIMQAHDTAIRGMEWSHDSQWLISGDQGGVIKYWQPNMNNVKIIQAHKEAIRDLSFCPYDVKFVSASDDSTLKLWDFNEGQEEAILSGHGWDVKCVDWHPKMGLIASGSKDNLVKLWDPRSRQCLNTIHGHNNTILGLKWNKNGWWLLSGSRDSNLRIFDIRKMDTLRSFRGITKEVTSVAWHPMHETLLASGGSEGSLMMWDVNVKDCLHSIGNAHESYVWSIDWHPVGHLLASGSNDHTTRFWARSRPGDYLESTELGVLPPLPPGATNASSLLHESSAANVMQGHVNKSAVNGIQQVSNLRKNDVVDEKPFGFDQKKPMWVNNNQNPTFPSGPGPNPIKIHHNETNMLPGLGNNRQPPVHTGGYNQSENNYSNFQPNRPIPGNIMNNRPPPMPDHMKGHNIYPPQHNSRPIPPPPQLHHQPMHPHGHPPNY